MSDPPLGAEGSVWIYLSFLFMTDSAKIRYVSKQEAKHQNVYIHVFFFKFCVKKNIQKGRVLQEAAMTECGELSA